MKKLFYILSLLFLTQGIFAQSAFEKGNALYQKGDFKGAAEAYNSIIQNNEQSAEVYFNLGNTYYKLNELAPSILNYEKALLIDPGNEDVAINLSIARKLIIDDVRPAPQTGFKQALFNVTGNYHYNTWAWVAVSFAGLCLVLFLGYYLSGTTLLKRIFFTGMFASVLCLVVSVLSAMFVKTEVNNQHPAIVFAEVASVKPSPSPKEKDAFVLHEGIKVDVLQTKDGYKKIKLADNSIGWIEADAIREVK
jgi:tetratricopeptide (TPR) repeat protein